MSGVSPATPKKRALLEKMRLQAEEAVNTHAANKRRKDEDKKRKDDAKRAAFPRAPNLQEQLDMDKFSVPPTDARMTKIYQTKEELGEVFNALRKEHQKFIQKHPGKEMPTGVQKWVLTELGYDADDYETKEQAWAPLNKEMKGFVFVEVKRLVFEFNFKFETCRNATPKQVSKWFKDCEAIMKAADEDIDDDNDA